MELQVRKKDGRQEPFQKAKIVNGAMRSGATQEQADMVATKVDAWARETAENGVIDSSSIRVKVVEELKLVNPQAGTAFETYAKPVGTTDVASAAMPAMPADVVQASQPVQPPAQPMATQPMQPEPVGTTPVQPVEEVPSVPPTQV